jgi:tetratricopeptide (TPR) repeat protein
MPSKLLRSALVCLPAVVIGTLAATGWEQRACAQDDQAGASQVEEKQVMIETDRLAAEAFKLDDRDPVSSVPSAEQAMRKPLQMGYFVMLLIERGKAASERGDQEAALKYYQALAKAVPERSKAFSLLCETRIALNDHAAALEDCKTALGKPGVTVDDNLRFVELMLKKPQALSASEVEDVEAVIAHLEKELAAEKNGPLVASQLSCELGSRLQDIGRLQACTERLHELAPLQPTTFVYSWSLAVLRRDFEGAKRIMERAKRAGLPADALAKMEAGMELQREQGSSSARWRPLAAGGALLSLLALGAFLFFTRRRRRRNLLADQPS